MASVFTRIIKGELPCYKIFENEHVLAFLALDQVQLGHTLIVPKIEVDHFIDVPEPYYSEVFKAAQSIGRALQKATQSKRVGAVIAGFDVPHFHYHLIPIFDISDLDFRKAKIRSKEDMVHIQGKIVSEINLQDRVGTHD